SLYTRGKWYDHYAEDYACGQYIYAHRGSLKKNADNRHILKDRLQKWLDVSAHDRRKSEKAPHAVDYTWYRCQKFNGNAYRPFQKVWGYLRDKNSNAYCYRDCHQQGKNGRKNCSINISEGAKGFLDRVPV